MSKQSNQIIKQGKIIVACFILLCLCACGGSSITQENTPAPTVAPTAHITAAPATNSPAPTEEPQPKMLPIDDPRDFLVGYWVDDKIFECDYTWEFADEDSGDVIYSFGLSPYEDCIRYAFYPDGQFLRATPQSEGGYPIWDYGRWWLSEIFDFIHLNISQRYVCGEDGTYIQYNHKCRVEVPVSIGSEYTIGINEISGRGYQDKIAINGVEFVRENGTWDLMNDFSYASTGEMHDGNSWDSDADSAGFSGAYGLPQVYFEGTILPGSEKELFYSTGDFNAYEYRIKLSRGTYGLLVHWNINFPTFESMESFSIPFRCNEPIESYAYRRIRFTGYTFFHEGFGFHITDIERIIK